MVVRRVIPSDNSCLFNAVGYVMDHAQKKAPELRQVIAATVASDPTMYSEAFLGKSNEEYCAWILDSEKWGGEEVFRKGYVDSIYDALAVCVSDSIYWGSYLTPD